MVPFDAQCPKQRAALLLAWLLLLALTACAPAAQNIPAAGDAAAQPEQSPRAVVEQFLSAWNGGNYEAMFNLIAQPSRDLYPLQLFTARYQRVAQDLEIDSINYVIQGETLNGETAIVRYGITLTSPRFGSIDDPLRVMRLVSTPRGWRVAWSMLDIFDGLAPDGQVRVDTTRLPRASIYDRSGLPLVQQNGASVAVFVSRDSMFGENECINLLTIALRRPRPEMAAFVGGYNADTLFYVGDMDPDAYARYSGDLNTLCGSSEANGRIRTRSTRGYYGRGAIAHVVGYVSPVQEGEQGRGYQPGDLVGRDGVEAAYEAELAGQASSVIRIVEPGGTTIRELGGSSGRAPQPVMLTIDRNLQLATANALADAFFYAGGNWGAPGRAAGGGAVVLDVNTGAVLALASYPTYDPGIFNPDLWGLIFDPQAYIAGFVNDPREPLFNRVTQGQYAPGSTFKIITTAAAAQEGLWTPDEIFYCDGVWNGQPFGDTLPSRSDWTLVDGLPPTGDVTIAGALMASCNPFYYTAGARLYNETGPGTLMRYAQSMGLGNPTGLPPIYREAPGSLPSLTSVEAAISSAIGQNDVQVTAIQMAHMVAGIANGGTLFQPFIVQQVGGFDGAPVTFSATPTAQGDIGLTPETLAIVQDGMCRVVSDQERGTARFAFQAIAYTACGKTGTAQSGRIEPHAWFVAYAPADNPQIAIAVVVPNSREGSEVAAPITRRILDAYFGAPAAPFPEWWNTEPYIELQVPTGGTAGG